MIPGAGTRALFQSDPTLRDDPRFTLYPAWMRRQVAAQPSGGGAGGPGGSGRMVLDVMRAGGLVVAGTDTPNGINLHGELMTYTLAGMSNFDALRTATVNPARALNLEAGTVEPGKLADLIMVAGDPLTDISHTTRVRRVVANGRVYDVNELVGPPRPTTPAAPRR
jgi:hypothetical protein